MVKENGKVIEGGREVKEHHEENKRKVKKNVGRGKLRLKKSTVGENEEDRG